MTPQRHVIIASATFVAGIVMIAVGIRLGYEDAQAEETRCAALEGEVGYWAGLAESENQRADENDYELREWGRWSAGCLCPGNRFTTPDPPEPLQVQPCVPPVRGRTYAVTEDTWATVSDPRERVAQAVLMTGGTMRVVDVVADRWDRQVVVDYQLPPDQEESGTLAPSGRAMLSVLRFCDATVGSAEAQRQVKLLEAP